MAAVNALHELSLEVASALEVCLEVEPGAEQGHVASMAPMGGVGVPKSWGYPYRYPQFSSMFLDFSMK